MTQHVLDIGKIPAQKTFMQSKVRELLYSGAFGAGKSRIGCEKGLFLSEKYSGNKGLVIRKTLASLKMTTQDTWFRYVMPEDHQRSFNKADQLLVLKNGSEILFAGLDKASKIGSFEAGWIFCDEIIEFTYDDYVMLLGRLRHPVAFRQIFGATNPASPHHWVYRHWYGDEKLKKDGVTQVVESDALANPFNPQDYRDSLNTLTGRYHERFVQGRWISFEGLIYDVWDPTRHILPRDATDYGLTGNPWEPIPGDWEIYRTIDFGFTNPFTCQWWAGPKYRYEGPAGRQDRVEIPFHERKFFLYKEIYMSGRTATEHAREINKITAGTKVHITFCDWDAGDRADLHEKGIKTNKANKDVQSGIESAYDMIANDQFYYLENSLVEKDESLVTDHKPTSLIEEFPAYQRPQGQDGRYDPKEEPRALNNHGLDALRYFAHTMTLMYGGGNRRQVIVSTNEDVRQRRTNMNNTPTHQTIGLVPITSGSRTYGAEQRTSWRDV